MPLLKLDRGDIYYEISGGSKQKNNSPIIILKPLSRGPIGIQPFIDILAIKALVVNYDQRGLGKSPSSTFISPVPLSERAKEVFELLDGLSINSAHIVCHSTGCGIGLSMIKQQPERILTLSLISPWTHADNYLTRIQNLRVSAAKALSPGDYFCYNISLLYPPYYRKQYINGFEKMELDAKKIKVDHKFVSDGLKPILEFDGRDILTTISCPTLVAHAADDQLMPSWFGLSILEQIPKSDHIQFESGGHMLIETRSKELASKIIKLIKKNEPNKN